MLSSKFLENRKKRNLNRATKYICLLDFNWEGQREINKVHLFFFLNINKASRRPIKANPFWRDPVLNILIIVYTYKTYNLSSILFVEAENTLVKLPHFVWTQFYCLFTAPRHKATRRERNSWDTNNYQQLSTFWWNWPKGKKM